MKNNTKGIIKDLKIAMFNKVAMVIVFTLTLTLGSIAQAQVSTENSADSSSRGDFTVSPGKNEMELSAGESKTIELTISNHLGMDKIFTITKEDMKGSEDQNRAVVLLGDERGPYSLKDYIHVTTTSINIANGQSARVPVTVSIPKDAEPGGLYGSLLVSTITKTSEAGVSDGATPTNALVTRIGTLFFVRVKGHVNEIGHLSSFILAGNQNVISGLPVIKFDLLYKNEGNVSVNPYGAIVVENMVGSSVGEIQIDPWFAMPQSSRMREVEWKTPFLFGRYTAYASINRGYGTVMDEMSISFWVIPWKMILFVLFGLVMIIIVFKWLFHKFKFIKRE